MSNFEDLPSALASLEEDEDGIIEAIDDVMDDDYEEPTEDNGLIIVKHIEDEGEV